MHVVPPEPDIYIYIYTRGLVKTECLYAGVGYIKDAVFYTCEGSF